MRKILILSEVNDRDRIGYQFEDSNWSSAKVSEDKNGEFFKSKGKKYYTEELRAELKKGESQ